LLPLTGYLTFPKFTTNRNNEVATTTITEVAALLGTIKTAKLDSLVNFDLLSGKSMRSIKQKGRNAPTKFSD